MTKKEKEKLFRLIKQGKSLNEICKEMRLKKTTAYYYVRKIRGRKIKPVVIDTSDEEKIGEFIGVFAGDGSYFYDKKRFKHVICISFNRKERFIAEYYANVIEKIAKKPYIYYRKNVVVVRVVSKEIISFIKNFLEWNGKKAHTVSLKKNVNKLSTKFLIGFLRGLIDSDGYVRKGRKEIYFGSVSEKLIHNFTKILDLFHFKYKVYKQTKGINKHFYKVRIANEEVDKFCRLVRPLKWACGVSRKAHHPAIESREVVVGVRIPAGPSVK